MNAELGQEVWRKRLLTAVDRDQRSDRRISIAAGLGENFVNQLRRHKKVPTIESFLALVDVLGTASAIYVLTGVEMNSRVATLLQAAQSLDPEVAEDFASLFSRLMQRATGEASSPDPEAKDGAKHQTASKRDP